MSRPKKKEEVEPLNPEMVEQIKRLLEMTSPKEAVQLQRYGNLTNGVIQRYEQLHAEIQKLLEF